MNGSRGSGNDWPSADRHAPASSLAAFAEGALPPDETRIIAAHVARCDECAERVAAYAEVDSLVRAAPAPIPPASLRAGLFARIGASEAPLAAQGYLVADEEMPTRIAETPALPPTETTPAHPSRLALPALPAFARWGGVVAATLIVALLAGVFVTLGRGRNSATTVAQPTATVLPQHACAPDKIRANLPEHTLLNDLTMTSPGTGWAVGATPDTLSTTTTYHSLILRLSDCKWEPFGASLPNTTLQSLAMGSLAEGWAAGAQGQKPLLLHYQNGAWNAVTAPPTGDILRFSIVRAGPSGEIWVAGVSPSEIAGRIGIAILRLSGGQWKRIETSFEEVYDIAPVGPGDAWIIGRKTPSVTVSFEELAHVRGGSLVSETPLDGAVALEHLRMFSPTDGWAMGVMSQGSDTTDNPQPSRAIALHYDGVKWIEVSTGASATARKVDVLGQGTAWSFTTKGVPEFIVSTQRQVAGQWRDIPWPFKDIVSFSQLTCVTLDDCWAIGFYLWRVSGEVTTINFSYLLLRYSNGSWHEYGHAT
jgi:hypothetical protein